MEIVAGVVFSILGLLTLPRVTLTVLAWILQPAFGVVVGILCLISLVMD